MKNKLTTKKLVQITFSNLLTNNLSLFLFLLTLGNYFLTNKNERNPYEVITLFLIMLIGAFSEAIQEFKKENARKLIMKGLQSTMKKLVLNELSTCTAFAIGDVVFLKTGDKVFHDVLIFEYKKLKMIKPDSHILVDESAITGENLPLYKLTLESLYNHTKNNKNSSNNDSLIFANSFPNLIFNKILHLSEDPTKIISLQKASVELNSSFIKAGSYIINGEVFGIITDTTKIKQSLKLNKNSKNNNLVLAKTFKKISNTMILSLSLLCMFIFIYLIICGEAFILALKISICLAVTAIPESLDLLIKGILLIVSRKLITKGVYVNDYRKLEILGNVDIICTDKTGTLTLNKQRLEHIHIFRSNSTFLESQIMQDYEKNIFFENPIYGSFFKYCNDIIIIDKKECGDPLDIAMYQDYLTTNKNNLAIKNMKKIPFCPIKKTIELEINIDGKEYLLIKGASENILAASNYIIINDEILKIDNYRKHILKEIDLICKKGYRVIGCAYKLKNKSKCDFIFVCYISFYDPPRNGVKDCVEWCKNNNIQIVVATGDSHLTTKSLCSKIGISNENIEDNLFIHGNNLSEHILKNNIEQIKSIFRAEPKHKKDFINFLINNEKIPLMIGDGINDIMALQQSPVSIAMGTGSSLCKDISDLVILNGDFCKVIECLKESKIALHNILCLMKYFISSNLGEVISILCCVVVQTKICIDTTHLLLVNLMTDALPSLVICMNKTDANNKKYKLNVYIIIRIICIGIYIGLGTFFIFLQYLVYDKNGPQLELKSLKTIDNLYYKKATTMCTFFICICEMFNIINNISLYGCIIHVNIWKSNKYGCIMVLFTIMTLILMVQMSALRNMLNFEQLDYFQILKLLCYALPVIVIDEMFKYFVIIK